MRWSWCGAEGLLDTERERLSNLSRSTPWAEVAIDPVSFVKVLYSFDGLTWGDIARDNQDGKSVAVSDSFSSPRCRSGR